MDAKHNSPQNQTVCATMFSIFPHNSPSVFCVDCCMYQLVSNSSSWIAIWVCKIIMVIYWQSSLPWVPVLTLWSYGHINTTLWVLDMGSIRVLMWEDVANTRSGYVIPIYRAAQAILVVLIMFVLGQSWWCVCSLVSVLSLQFGYGLSSQG